MKGDGGSGECKTKPYFQAPGNAVVMNICEYTISPLDKRDDSVEWVTVKSSPVLTSTTLEIIVRGD